MEELLKKYLGFSKTESKVLAILLEGNKNDEYFDLKDIVKKTNRHRSSVSKVIKYIDSFGILKTRQINLDRGFKLEYKIISKVKVFSMIEKQIKDNYKQDLLKLSEINRGLDD